MGGLRRTSAILALFAHLSASPASAADDAAAARVDALFASYAAPSVPGCAVGVSEGGQIVFARGYGTADLTWGQPITPETNFDVASVSKQFVAYATVLLADRGALSLTDSVRKHLTDLPDWGDAVTLEQLLDHTSGLPSYDTIATVVGRPTRSEMTTDLAYGLVRRIPAPDFEPGSDWSYSNTNYLLLARVVEAVSGRTLSDFLEAEVFEPAAMALTRFAPDLGAPLPGRAQGYTPTSADGFREGPVGGSDGGSRGLQSNVADLLAWADALDSGRLGAAVRQRMMAPRQLNSGEVMRYGAGLDIDRLNGRLAVRHSGSDWRGYTSEVLRLPAERLAVAVLCNRSDAAADLLAERTVAAWLGEPFEDQAPRPLSDSQRGAAGRYIAPDGRAFELRIEGGAATARPLTAGALTPVDDVAFGFGLASRGARLVIDSGRNGVVWVYPPVGRPLEYRRYQPVAPDAEALAAYRGRYLSSAFDAVLPIDVTNGSLVATDLNGAPRVLAPTIEDSFVLGGNTGFTFERDASGRVVRLIISQARARRLVFDRLDVGF